MTQTYSDYINDEKRRIPPKIRHALELLAAYSETGKELYEWCITQGVQFVEDKLQDQDGLYRHKTVITNEENSVLHNICITAHEMMHAVQDYHPSHFNLNALHAPFNNHLAYLHAQERGAVTCHIRCLFEMKLNAYSDPWEHALNHINSEHFTPLLEHFEKAFTQHQTEQPNATKKESLDLASNHVFNQYLYSQAISCYNTAYFSMLLHYHVAATLKKLPQPPETNDLTTNDLMIAATLPSLTSLIGDAPDLELGTEDTILFPKPFSVLKDAFRYLELQYNIRKHGKYNSTINQQVESLANTELGNVFLNKSYPNLIDALSENPDKSAFDILCEEAGIKAPRQKTFSLHGSKDYEAPAPRPSPVPF